MIHIRIAQISLVTGAVLFGSHAIGAPNDEKQRDIEVSDGGKLAAKPRTGGATAPEEHLAANLRKIQQRSPVSPSHPNQTAAPTAPDAIGRFLSSMARTSAASPLGMPSRAEIQTIKDAIRLARRGKINAAADRRDQVHDTIGKGLVEWVTLRSGDIGNEAMSSARYAVFVRAHPSWPSINLFRRRAEVRLWIERSEPSVVFAFFSGQEPLSALGKLAIARAHLTRGNRRAAQEYARSAWHDGNFSAQLEEQVLATFGPLLTTADHRARMSSRLYANDLDGAMRAASRLGATAMAIVKARAAVNHKAGNAHTLLNAVPMAARADPAYMFTRIQWLRRGGHVGEAAALMLSVSRDPGAIRDPDAWWTERRILVRKLLDDGKVRLAYRIASEAVLPSKESLRVDQLFTAGWIALRFLNDPHTAAQHFARMPQITTHPTSLARAGYWLGRAAEAAGHSREARRYYEGAARHSAAYYGQLAGARLGQRKIALRRPPKLNDTQRATLRNIDLVRAVELLYATGNQDLVIPFVADLDRIDDVGVLTLIAETTARYRDARAMLTLGKNALVRGLAFDPYAFPRFGLPKYVAVGPKAPLSLVYALARAESAFNARVVSSANAHGLMQVTPQTGQTIARRLGTKFEPKRLLSDPSYNVQLGSAEIADLVNTYDGNHVLAFVGYNAGRGRAREWIALYGDPRDPNVDAVDWVERIPFVETRTYVQRVMENLQVYRSRFSESARLTIEADMRGGNG
ncbi:lytic transglycosylase domain-containing protein [Bradyrhizobium sp. CNPSo 4026]|nr:lytic transglycosylase domain-containing protein [Bradyrhizobium cenepequi]